MVSIRHNSLSSNAPLALAAWDAEHTITGMVISDVTGLQAALDAKQPLAGVLTGTTASFTTAQETKLAGIATGATANATDAQLRDRATHTGAQAISTVTGLQTALDAKQATLLSGTNIKTVNGTSLLGSGNIVIPAGADGADGENVTITTFTDEAAFNAATPGALELLVLINA